MALVSEAIGRLAGVIYDGCAPDSMSEIMDKATDRIVELENELTEEKKWAKRYKAASDLRFDQVIDNAAGYRKKFATLERKIESQAIGIEQSHRDEKDSLARVAELEGNIKDNALLYRRSMIVIEEELAASKERESVLEARLGEVREWAAEIFPLIAEVAEMDPSDIQDLAIEKEDMDTLWKIISDTLSKGEANHVK